MKVRATQDGHYGGYYRLGPILSDQTNQSFPGEVFEIDDKPFPVLDMDGKPIIETDTDGKKIMKDGKPKLKMGNWFSPAWMVRVPDETPVTYDYPPFQIPVQYREVKSHNAPVAGGVSPSPASVI